MSNESENTISALREHLFAALKGLRDKDNPMDIERAKAISEVAKTVIDTAKVEVEYLRLNGGGESEFIDGVVGQKNLPAGIRSHTVHRLKG